MVAGASVEPPLVPARAPAMGVGRRALQPARELAPAVLPAGVVVYASAAVAEVGR